MGVAGDLNVRVSVNSEDEIGELSRYINLFIESMQNQTQQIRRGNQ